MGRFLILILLNPVFFFLSLEGKRDAPGGNHPPVVEIISPEDSGSYQLNANVRYKVRVSDREDGESRYKEIPAKDVVLEVRYRSGLSGAQLDSIRENVKMPEGLVLIGSHNCLNCHQMNAKSTGPSFKRINARYEHTKMNIALLSKRIIKGSSGVWGDQTMPGHPKLTKKAAAAIVNWVFNHGKDSTLQLYTGMHGFFRIRPAGTSNSSTPTVVVLTASYTDHGLKGTNSQRLTGSDRVIIQVKGDE